jgi:hypothetical protein
MAKTNNDRTPVQVESPISAIIESQMKKQSGRSNAAAGGSSGANEMVKNLASSFLSKQQTVMEYDIGQANGMQLGIIFNIILMWVMHYKFQQVQPLLVAVVNGLVQLAYSPLFQVYVLGRNLERPFKAPSMNMVDNTPTEENTELSKNNIEEVAKNDTGGDASAVDDEDEAEDVEKSEDEDADDDDEEEEEDVEQSEDDM